MLIRSVRRQKPVGHRGPATARLGRDPRSRHVRRKSRPTMSSSWTSTSARVNDAMMRCIAEQQRSRSRRERRTRRLQYEEMARNHNIQRAAEKAGRRSAA